MNFSSFRPVRPGRGVHCHRLLDVDPGVGRVSGAGRDHGDEPHSRGDKGAGVMWCVATSWEGSCTDLHDFGLVSVLQKYPRFSIN